MKTLSEKQKIILGYALSNNSQISKAQAVEILRHYYYSNAQKYVGDILSRMVSSKILKRVKNGMFKINDSQNSETGVNSNQLTLL